ncbi:MAG: glutathione S-transferase N-terminal domain-containing protein [Inhella sp.]
MTLLELPIARRYPPQHPDRLQLYSLPTPNGVKVSIALEELAIPYEAHRVDFGSDAQKEPAFLALNGNGKIPAIADPNGPEGLLQLAESGAILVYLAEQTGRLWPQQPAARAQALQWLMFQMGGIGPMFGQLGFFHKFAGSAYEDKRPRDRYVAESRRLLGVLDERLDGRDWMMGSEFTMVDIATFPWIRNLIDFYAAGELVGYADFRNVQRVLESFLARPAVQRGLSIPSA